MGRTFAEVMVQNAYDIELRESGQDPEREVREATVRALADTGSALLCLHKDTIDQLGLRLARAGKVRTGNGIAERRIYRAAQITILGRGYLGEVMEVPDDVPVLVGYIPLESLDLVIDPRSNQVIHNPENGGEYTLDLL